LRSDSKTIFLLVDEVCLDFLLQNSSQPANLYLNLKTVFGMGPHITIKWENREMSIATRALELSLTGAARIPALGAQLSGIMMVGEVGLRGCEAVGKVLGVERATKAWDDNAPDFVKDATRSIAKYSGLEMTLSACRPFKDMDTTKLVLSTVAILVWSTAAVEGVNFFYGAPHPIYNKVLQFTSWELRDQSGIVPMLQNAFQAWNAK
jgi:hypothetical protein